MDLADDQVYCMVCYDHTYTNRATPRQGWLLCPIDQQHTLCASCFATYVNHCCDNWAVENPFPMTCSIPDCQAGIQENTLKILLVDNPDLWGKYQISQLRYAINCKNLAEDGQQEVPISCTRCNYCEILIPADEEYWNELARNKTVSLNKAQMHQHRIYDHIVSRQMPSFLLSLEKATIKRIAPQSLNQDLNILDSWVRDIKSRLDLVCEPQFAEMRKTEKLINAEKAKLTSAIDVLECTIRQRTNILQEAGLLFLMDIDATPNMDCSIVIDSAGPRLGTEIIRLMEKEGVMRLKVKNIEDQLNSLQIQMEQFEMKVCEIKYPLQDYERLHAQHDRILLEASMGSSEEFQQFRLKVQEVLCKALKQSRDVEWEFVRTSVMMEFRARQSSFPEIAMQIIRDLTASQSCIRGDFDHICYFVQLAIMELQSNIENVITKHDDEKNDFQSPVMASLYMFREQLMNYREVEEMEVREKEKQLELFKKNLVKLEQRGKRRVAQSTLKKRKRQEGKEKVEKQKQKIKRLIQELSELRLKVYKLSLDQDQHFLQALSENINGFIQDMQSILDDYRRNVNLLMQSTLLTITEELVTNRCQRGQEELVSFKQEFQSRYLSQIEEKLSQDERVSDIHLQLSSSTIQFFMCKNADCDVAYCTRCQKTIDRSKLEHIGHICIDDEVERIYVEVTELLTEGGTMPCPACGLQGIKDLACTHITCSKCSEGWCYHCGMKYSDIGDLSEHNNWRDDPASRCPMYLEHKYGGTPAEALTKFHRERQENALNGFQELCDPDIWERMVAQKFPKGIFVDEANSN